MNIQLYDDDNMMRGFVGHDLIFEAKNVDWRVLDAMGLPRLGKEGRPWQRTDWGYEIDVTLKAAYKDIDAKSLSPKHRRAAKRRRKS